MARDFFEETKDLKEKIKNFIKEDFSKIKDPRIREILLQRQATSSFIKGISAYYIHRGLNGPLSEEESIELAGILEIYSTGLVILDNIVDNHEIRNNQTTYLREHGHGLNTLASQYSTHIGLIRLVPYISRFQRVMGGLGENSIEEAIEGMISMDIDKPRDSVTSKETIARVNGITLGMPLALVASTASEDKYVIYDTLKYGYDVGLAFGLYEELRDLVGEHGRKKAYEIRNGRSPYCLIVGSEKSNSIDLSDYVGKDLTNEEHRELLKKLKECGAIEHTKTLIKNHLSYGSESLQRNLNKIEFDILDGLRITLEDSLEKLI